MNVLKQPLSFQWDQGNKDKNWRKHKVSNQECEKAFYDPHKRIVHDIFHLSREKRYILLGKSRKRVLFIVFTIRKNKLRVISARDIKRKERKLYAKRT